MSTIKYLILAMRPKQWPKNAIVFAGVVFDNHLFQYNYLLKAFIAFILFCGISSAVYLLNDLVDIEKDRQHPKKRFRPLPSGKLKPRVAFLAMILLVAITIPISLLLSWKFGVVISAYFIIQIAYSFYLKNIVIIDVFTISSGFVLRAVGGAFVIEVNVSVWLLVCTMLLSLFLGLSKRRHELVLLAEGATDHRRILKEYTSELVQEMISVVTSSVVIAYSLYTITAPNLPKNNLMPLTIPFVLYAIFRYLYLVYRRDEGGSPEETLLKDYPLLIDIFLWGITSIVILYVFK
ncbi:decaprenyl-phosphate phosphoribosyltransferase [Candidatus Chlorohelix sp.]|uniref:decaprenyl-phosphate phosphoribosyltransferase n=1 Tax=Candidatus Chlorohelix sp. TaxID=3139201 RepID=UPI0030436A5D